MATNKWRSSLANVETRLRRSLGLSGPIGTELNDPLPVQPVVIVDDATRPGGSVIRGTRWTACFRVEDADDDSSTGLLYTDSPTGVIVDSIDIFVDRDSSFAVVGVPPGADYSGYPQAPFRGAWLTENPSLGNFAPLWVASDADGGGISSQVLIWSLNTPGNQVDDISLAPLLIQPTQPLINVPLNMYLAPPTAPSLVGGGMIIGFPTTNFTGDWSAVVRGRVY